MECNDTTHPFRCDICSIAYETAAELAWHNKIHGTPSNTEPQITPPKRVRRKAMDVVTFARFCNNSAEVLRTVIIDFDPTPVEAELMLKHITGIAQIMITTTKRRTS